MLSNLKKVKPNFDKAATNYIKHAFIQKESANLMLSLLDNEVTRKDLILDLGSGPGTLLHINNELLKLDYLNQQTVLYDISYPMLKQSINHYKINGNASFLPFANDSFKLIMSNLMVQWITNKEVVFNEIYRVLKPGGILLFSVLVKPSLWQLHNAQSNLPISSKRLDLLTNIQYYQLLNQGGFQLLEYKNLEQVLYFVNMLELVRHFKLNGTLIKQSLNSSGLNGRHLITQLERAYWKYQTIEGLPLTYSSLIIKCIKKDY